LFEYIGFIDVDSLRIIVCIDDCKYSMRH